MRQGWRRGIGSGQQSCGNGFGFARTACYQSFTMRERFARLSLRLGAPLSVGLVLGVIGPFGTFDLLPATTRLPYWLIVVSANWLLADAILRRVDTLGGARLPVPRLLVPLLGACFAAVPATGIVALANGLSGIGWPEDVALLVLQVLVLLAAIALPVYTWEDMRERMEAGPDLALADPTEQVVEGPTQERAGLSLFAARLAGPIDGRLLCLEMQDHYLIVHHTSGSEMILCRMEDASRELEGLGRRVHRSWWVAADAVTGTEREGQRTLLRLSDERLVPVGRSFRADLRSADWL